MSLSQLPPVIAGLKSCLQDDYMHASGDPLRRMIIIQEYAARFKLTGADYLALAVEEVRHAYQNVGGLPEGEYRNGHGDTFTVDDWGKLSSMKKSAPPTPNSTWVPRFFRRTTGPVPPGYHFILGAWDWVQPTPPPDGLPSYHVPAGLEGARYLGVVPSMTQHFQSSGYLPQLSGGGQGSNISAEFGLQQPLAAAESSQYSVNLTAANTQQPVPVVSGDAPQYGYVSASTLGQQPAATDFQIGENFEGSLQYSLQKYSDGNTVEESVSQETQLTGLENSFLESTMYPGYAPARGYRGPAQ